VSSSGFHLNKAEGKFLGVCAGIADYTGIDALWVRAALVGLTLLGWGTAIPVYFLVAFLASPRPSRIDYDAVDDERYLERMRRRRSSRMRNDVSEMDRRLSEMEHDYGRSSRLSSEIDRLS
jgi:phage shock protein C